MISKKIESAINAQIEKEGYSSQLYLAMASWAEVNGYQGVSEWFYAQAEEERMHMLKFLKYVNERGGTGIVGVINQPPQDFKSVKIMFEEALKHEEFITNSINEIVYLCTSEKDFTTQNFLQWFVNEQIEEERNARAVIDKLKLLGDGNLYHFDNDIMKMRQAASAANAAADAGV